MTPRNVACKAGKRKELHEHFEDDENPVIAKQGRKEEVYRSGVYTNLKTVPKRLVCCGIDWQNMFSKFKPDLGGVFNS